MPEGRVLCQLDSHRNTSTMNANMLDELSKDKLGRLAASIFCWIHQETSTQFSVSIAFGHAKKQNYTRGPSCSRLMGFCMNRLNLKVPGAFGPSVTTIAAYARPIQRLAEVKLRFESDS